jgi:three-Cys-motif partner protein
MQKFGGDWSRKKLSALRDYLDKFNTALKKTNFRRYYIDVFAGTGGQILGKAGDSDQALLPINELEPSNRKFLSGSARIALEAAPGFHEFIFSDISNKNFRQLDRLKKKFSTRIIQIRQGDANAVLRDVIRKIDWKNSRAVVFLDPFGAQVEWKTLELLANTKAIDLWYLFPSGLAVIRQLSKNDSIRPDIDRRLTMLFGTVEWRDVFTKPNPQQGLFGEMEPDRIRDVDMEKVEGFLIERLQSIFAKVVPECLRLYSNSNAPMYSLCFAAANAKGAEIACRIARHVIRDKGSRNERHRMDR